MGEGADRASFGVSDSVPTVASAVVIETLAKETFMLQVKRIGHATLTTPDLERQLDYYTRVIGLSVVHKEKGRAILATRVGQEVIVLEHGDRAAGVRLSFQVAPGTDLDAVAFRLSVEGIRSERRSGITPGIAQAIVFKDPKGTSVEIFSDQAFTKDDDSDG